MDRRKRRLRIVMMVMAFLVLGFLMTSGLNPLEAWLGWSLANWVLMGIAALLMIGVLWEVLGFFIDKR